ncbi:MFS transporter [Streptomyces sp. NPDC097619]|uniref:MFS transporter n=1 Tax=Streptomyces sp. NPDC097619 TaxID=3157228 RepID=UPI003316F57C
MKTTRTPSDRQPGARTDAAPPDVAPADAAPTDAAPTGPPREPDHGSPPHAPLQPPLRTPLWDHRFSLYFASRSVSMLGDAMMPVATALAVGALYGISGVGLVLGVWTGTFVLLVLFGGVFADRFGARRMMVGADFVRVLTQGVLAAAFFTGTPPFWLLVTMAALAGAAVAMFLPGVNGMVPLVAREPQRANATLKVADALAHLLGPALAGLLITVTGAGTVYAIDAGTFLISALCLGLIRLDPRGTVGAAGAGRKEADSDSGAGSSPGSGGFGSAGGRAEGKGRSGGEGRSAGSLRSDLRQGWREFKARTWMWSVILIWVFFGMLVFGPLVPIGSALIGDRLGPDAYGLTVSFLGAGTVLGGLVALRVRPARPLAAGAVAMLLYTAMPLAIALDAGLPLLLTGHALAGGGLAFWSVMWATSVQTHTPPEVLNRVTAYELAGSVAGIALGQILAGPATALAPPERLLLVSAATCLLGCTALLTIPAIRALRRPTRPTTPTTP